MKRLVRGVFLGLLILIFSACRPHSVETIAPSPTYAATSTVFAPSETLAPTVSPTASSTPVPPLVAHKWAQSEPLIVLDGHGGDGGCGFEGALPGFTILPNGGLYSVDEDKDSNTYEIKTTTLSRQSVCNLLNSIDQAGFFDYDPSTYVRDSKRWRPPTFFGSTDIITVHAWRSNSVSLYGLSQFINMADEIKKAWEPTCGTCPDLEFPTILPAIRKTSQLLWSYEPTDLHLYQSERLGVWFDSYTEMNVGVEWPLKSPRLSSIVPAAEPYLSNSPNAILSGADATRIYKLFDQRIDVCGITVQQDGTLYRAFARPLLPNEYLSAALPMTSLSCSPSDGWVETP